MIKFRLYIPPVILGFVIVPLLVWPTVIVLAVLIFTLTFLAEIIFSFPLLVVRISLQELQLELMVEYALFFSVMAGIGWQFSRRTPPELKNRLHCWLVFSPVYFWLILSNFILYISPEYFSREISVAGKYPKFLSDVCLASPEFFPFLAAALD